VPSSGGGGEYGAVSCAYSCASDIPYRPDCQDTPNEIAILHSYGRDGLLA